MEFVTDISLWQLIRHLKQWLVNLRKAGLARKAESVDALRAVIVAARQTSAYVRRLSENGQQDHKVESKLAATWTELSFLLSDLKLNKLAKRCDIKGRYWANPTQFDAEFLDKADVGLERMEQLARQTLAEIER